MGGRECNLLRAGKLASKEEAQDSHGGPEGGGRAERPHPACMFLDSCISDPL